MATDAFTVYFPESNRDEIVYRSGEIGQVGHCNYRPLFTSDLRVASGADAVARISIATNGNVSIQGVTSAFTLDGLRFSLS